MFLSRAILPVLLILSQPLLAATALIPLQHRSAEELLPIAQTLLDDGETLAAHQQQLLVRASLERINELRGILTQLDMPARQLLISLDSGSGQPLPGYHVIGPSAHANPARPPRIVTAGQSAPLQVRASEGEPAFIDFTRSELQLGFSVDLDGTPYIQSQESRSGTGLQVVARLQGNHVQLDLSAQRSSTDSAMYGARDTLFSETRLVGRLGEWIEVSSGNLPVRDKRLSTQSEERPALRIRVDALD